MTGIIWIEGIIGLEVMIDYQFRSFIELIAWVNRTIAFIIPFNIKLKILHLLFTTYPATFVRINAHKNPITVIRPA